MRVVPGGWNVVVVGAWNIAILNPEWLAKNLFGSGDVKIEIPVGGQALPFLRVTCDGVRVLAAPDKVLFSPVEINNATLEKLEKSAMTLLELLPHTPIAAIGVNFAFVEDDPSEGLLNHFPDPDLSAIVDLGFVSEAQSVTRHLKHGADTLNLKVRWDGRSLGIEFNFHRDVGTATAAAEAVKGHILEHRDVAYALLSRVYGLTGEVE